jgi:hypothetical protein
VKDMRAVRGNEKIKRMSTLFGNGGLALLIAGFSRSYGVRLDLSAVAWIFITLSLIWLSWQLNELLESEDET